MIIRPATAADAQAFYGGAPIRGFRGIVADKDGEIIGIGGIYFDSGFPIAWSEFGNMSKKERAIGARALIRFLDGLGFPVCAFASSEHETAKGLLSKLGFVPTGMIGPQGEMLRRG